MSIKDQLNALKQADLAALFDVTDRTIQRWHEQGLPRHGSGRGTTYVWSEILPWYMGFMSGPVAGQGGDLNDKERKAKADADIAEMNAAKMRGNLIDAEEAQKVWEAFLASFKTTAQGFHQRVAPMLEDGMILAERQAVLQEQINGLLRTLVAVAEEGAADESD